MQAVTVALSEPSIAVREATLDLLGGYIISRPATIAKYYESIVKRLADVGISVRPPCLSRIIGLPTLVWRPLRF